MAKFAAILVCLVLAQVMFPGQVEGRSFKEAVKEKGQKMLAAITTPVQKLIVGRLLENCDSLKRLLGVTYEKLNFREPKDKSVVELDIWKGEKKTTFNINDANGRHQAAEMLNPRLPVAIFLHGFLSDSESEAALEVTRALTKKGGLNVLALDASEFIRKYYVRSSTCVRFIGEDLGLVMADFVKHGISPKRIHVIGHSLGSHIAGFAGKKFHELTKKTIGRISGLDPAGPCFFREHSDLRLNKTDADFVDVVHTDSGILGLSEPIGDVDFYPNGGEKQPGCVVPPCSHSWAWRLFSESILNPSPFVAVRCRGWGGFMRGHCGGDTARMGYGAEPSKRGTFYLRTSRDAPYGLGRKGTNSEANFHKNTSAERGGHGGRGGHGRHGGHY